MTTKEKEKELTHEEKFDEMYNMMADISDFINAMKASMDDEEKNKKKTLFQELGFED